MAQLVECNSQGKPNFLKAESHYVMQTIRKFTIDFLKKFISDLCVINKHKGLVIKMY